MTSKGISREARLEELLDAAFTLDEEARRCFLSSDNVEPELRQELAELLQAAAADSPIDRAPTGLATALLAEQSLSIVNAGQQFGHYRLIRLLGEGGMASVWLAERDDASFHHQVAVKCLKTGLNTPDRRTRFLREQQILAQLQHPYIARLYDAGISNDQVPFIVMEWVDGGSLTCYCDEHRFHLKQRLQLFQKACGAVTYAHQNLIVHRDLKPANILIGSDGEPKLLDFGIAKLLDDAEPMTRSGMHLLTPEYAAPEQFSGAPITTATDVYGLGAILYELLCGLRPKQVMRNHPMPVVNSIITAPSQALRRISKTVSLSTNSHDPRCLAEARASGPERLQRALRGDLDTIVLKALQEEPHRRYATVQALSEDIERYLLQQPIRAHNDTWTYRAGRFLRRHALGVALSSLMIAALLTATVISVYQARRAEIETQRAWAVKEFLTNLFEVSDAGVPRDQVPTTETLLTDGANRIRNQFNNAPELKLDLLLLLGHVQLNLGRYDQAEPLLKEALTIADANFSLADERWLKIKIELATLLLQQGHYEDAKQLLIVAIAQHRSVTKKENMQLADALATLGQAYSNLDQFDQAISITQEALEMFKHLLGENHPSVQGALARLGNAYSAAGQLEMAETTHRASLVLSRELYGEQHIKYAESLSALSFTLQEERKDVEAEQAARESLAIVKAIYSHPNAALIGAHFQLGNILIYRGKLDEAESLFKHIIELQTQLNGPDSPDMASNLISLASITVKTQKYQEAENLLRQALNIVQKTSGPQHTEVGKILLGMARVFIKTQRYEQATSTLQEALKIGRLSFKNEEYPIGIILTKLAEAENKFNHLQQASEHIEEALRILGKSFSDNNPYINEALIIKSNIMNNLLDHKAAKDLLTSLIARLRQAEPTQQINLIDSLIELGHTQRALGETDIARANWIEALALMHTMQPLDIAAIAQIEKLITQLDISLHTATKTTRPTP